MDPSRHAELLAALREGSAAAFDEVYEHYRARLFSFVWRMTNRRDVAEDLLQETWLRFARHAVRLRDDTELGAWLFTVARNLATSHLRWRWLDAERVRDLVLQPARAPETPVEQAAAAQTERRLEAAVAALPQPFREALLLVAVDGLTPAVAAAVVGIAPDTFRKRLERARAALARALEDGR